MRPWVAFSLVLAACSVQPRDGQFLCPGPDELCPEGQVCVAGVCRDMAGEVDAGDEDGGDRDAGPPRDASDDAGIDAGPPPDESCAPSSEGASVDEDADGVIDEGCSWHLGTPHLVAWVHVGRTQHFNLALDATGTDAYVGTDQEGVGVQRFDRADVGAPFATAPTELVGTAAPGARYRVVSVNADATTLAAQTETGVQVFSRSIPVDPFAPLGPELAGVHPSLSPNGLELFVTDNSVTPSVIRVYGRSSADLMFGASRVVTLPDATGSVISPFMMADGNTLLYVESGIGGQAAIREDGDEFGLAVSVPTGAFEFISYNPITREMWMSTTGRPDGPPGIYALYRAQVCRGAACAPEPSIECPPPAALGADGFHCFERRLPQLAWGAARDACGADGHLATFVSMEDGAGIAGTFTGSAWIGLNDDVAASTRPEEWTWANGEPLLFESWSGGAPGTDPADNCARMTGMGAWFNERCGNTSGYICETEALPRWLP